MHADPRRIDGLLNGRLEFVLRYRPVSTNRTLADRHVLATNNSAMFLYGLSAVLIGPTLPGMISGLDLSLSEGGLIGSAQNAGGFLGALVALWVADRLPRAASAVASFVLLAAALLAVSFARAYLALLLTFAATGFFIRLLDVMLNAHTGEIAGSRSGRPLSVLHMFFSVGAFVGPIVARAIMSAGASWDEVFRYVGVAYLAVVATGAWWIRSYVASGARDADPTQRPIRVAAPERSPRSARLQVVLLGAALFFYAMHQIGLTSWVPYFLETSRGAAANVASLGLSLYWVGIIAGRFVASRIVERTGVAPVLIVGCFVSAVATVAAVVVASVPAAIVLLWLAGASSGATIPLAYAMGFASVPSRTASVTAAMSVIMLAGRFVSPWLIGAVADAASLIPAMAIPGAALVASGAFVIGAGRID